MKSYANAFKRTHGEFRGRALTTAVLVAAISSLLGCTERSDLLQSLATTSRTLIPVYAIVDSRWDTLCFANELERLSRITFSSDYSWLVTELRSDGRDFAFDDNELLLLIDTHSRTYEIHNIGSHDYEVVWRASAGISCALGTELTLVRSSRAVGVPMFALVRDR